MVDMGNNVFGIAFSKNNNPYAVFIKHGNFKIKNIWYVKEKFKNKLYFYFFKTLKFYGRIYSISLESIY